ncbi:alpha/beta fold hydrolase [Capillimicrobium parvum]|uniref:2-succinyl-6-hydroxy-2, 4-cyclohexadiene-1-carboxylate synthase n=1 Tax=Capillimicrobium parvum TaxID=2884022 RepID=A0A9E7C008_9ACTN|nr:alpha/beta fold hydrolase [Capillimicrobium parvum]UGS35881.1 2-succinyl-6-hydroxy-2,4-cyclohexadiene-1-carboxylate synthase [Capillimicrobium parvum]
MAAVARPVLGLDRGGDGPPLVLLHPLGADRHVWAPVWDRVAAHREVVSVDLPGFGGSPPLPDAVVPTPAALARAVAAGLAAHGLDRFHVAGNSLGGWVALELALAGRAESVTAIAPAGLWPEPLMPRRGAARRLARAALPAVALLARSERGRRLALLGTVAHPERIPPADAAHLVRAYATAPGFEAVDGAMRAGRFLGLAGIRVALTLAWPEHDRLVARPGRLPERARSVVLDGCGHLPMWDDPAQVAAVLLEGSAVAAAP